MSGWLLPILLVVIAVVLVFALWRDHAVSLTMRLLGVALHIETKHRESEKTPPSSLTRP